MSTLFICVCVCVCVLLGWGGSTETPSEVSSDTLVAPDMIALHVRSEVSHRYAVTSVVSRLRNPAQRSQEVTFTLVLPEDAFISACSIEVDGHVYHAYVKEKEEAAHVYEEAVQGGQTAAHVGVSARDSNTFTVSVNVEPSQKVTFNLTYEELLRRTLGRYTHMINLDPGQPVEDLTVEVHITEDRNITSLNVPKFRGSNEIPDDEESTSNPLASIQRPSGHQAVIRFAPSVRQQEELAGPGSGVRGQLVLTYDVDRDPQGGEVLVRDGYFVHFFSPATLPTLPKHVVFVLDVSGSMAGRKMEQLKEAMATILGELSPHDYFSIVEFSYSVTVWHLDSSTHNVVLSPYGESPGHSNLSAIPAFAATPENISKAKDVVSNMTAGGGTNIEEALRTGLQVAHRGVPSRPEAGVRRPEPLLIFLTDGEPTVGETRPSRLLAMVKELQAWPGEAVEGEGEGPTALYSLAFGEDADYPFLRTLSLQNHGFSRRIYEGGDAPLQLRHLYRQVASPLLANVSFRYTGEVDDTGTTDSHFPYLFGGSELVVAGRLTHPNGTLALSAEVVGHSQRGESHFAVNGQLPREEGGSLERAWAYLRVRDLLERAEGEGEQEEERKREAEATALQLALKYSFVTRLTSLVVVKPQGNTSTPLQGASSGRPNHGGFISGGFGLPGAMGPPGLYPHLAAAPQAPVLHRVDTLLTDDYPGATAQEMEEADTDIGLAAAGRPWSTTAAEATSATTLALPPSAGPLLTSLNDLRWLADATNGTDHVAVPLANATDIYRLGLDQANDAFDECVYPGTDMSVTAHCRHLTHCVLTSFVSDIQEYAKYFCSIGEYAGVCCPDQLQMTTVAPSN